MDNATSQVSIAEPCAARATVGTVASGKAPGRGTWDCGWLLHWLLQRWLLRRWLCCLVCYWLRAGSQLDRRVGSQRAGRAWTGHGLRLGIMPQLPHQRGRAARAGFAARAGVLPACVDSGFDRVVKRRTQRIGSALLGTCSPAKGSGALK